MSVRKCCSRRKLDDFTWYTAAHFLWDQVTDFLLVSARGLVSLTTDMKENDLSVTSVYCDYGLDTLVADIKHASILQYTRTHVRPPLVKHQA